ncbi:uncharacterized protein LOC126035466 isoform X5 [Accipiter gentilis]|uniref:uncharacterized protein LOC126035466 isoform X5 n=1 Tax=Astur gentilis TaxID=8957 RepID=UPI0021108E0C|nr:uncharacterized protein LOC126035466 isoform X5 [Accipiter gentilis]
MVDLAPQGNRRQFEGTWSRQRRNDILRARKRKAPTHWSACVTLRHANGMGRLSCVVSDCCHPFLACDILGIRYKFLAVDAKPIGGPDVYPDDISLRAHQYVSL